MNSFWSFIFWIVTIVFVFFYAASLGHATGVAEERKRQQLEADYAKTQEMEKAVEKAKEEGKL